MWVRVNTSTGEDEPLLPVLTKRQQEISVSVVGVIGMGWKSPLGWLPRNWNRDQLPEVFSRDVLPAIKGKLRRGQLTRLIWDNDGRHFAAPWLELEDRERLNPIRPHPSNSPDLNPIENVWSLLKRDVEEAGPTTEQELRDAIQAAWDRVSRQRCTDLMNSLPSRLAAARRLKGGRTKY